MGNGGSWAVEGGDGVSYIRYTTDGTSNMLDIRTTDGISDISLLHIRYTTEMTSHQSEIPHSLIFWDAGMSNVCCETLVLHYKTSTRTVCGILMNHQLNIVSLFNFLRMKEVCVMERTKCKCLDARYTLRTIKWTRLYRKRLCRLYAIVDPVVGVHPFLHLWHSIFYRKF